MSDQRSEIIKRGPQSAKKKGNPNIRNIDKDEKPVLRPGSNISQCAECSLFFTGVSPFDDHLLTVEAEDEQGDDTIRCRTVLEMQAIGMRPNKHGVWHGRLSKKQLGQVA